MTNKDAIQQEMLEDIIDKARTYNDGWVFTEEELIAGFTAQQEAGRGYSRMEQLFIELTKWQEDTFSEATALSKVHHLEEEVKELKEDLQNNNFLHTRLEFADCFLLLFGAAKSDGMTFEDICNCISEKLEICKNRKWGKPDANGVVKHLPTPPTQ